MTRSRAVVGLATLGLAVGTATASPAEAAGPVQLGTIQYNSPGADNRTNASLNAEYVVIKNLGATTRTLTGYTLRDAQNHVYTFGTFRLAGYRSVTVHTGKGTNSGANRYWGSTAYVWNNTGDKAILRNSAGTLLDTCSWGSTGSSRAC